MENNRNFRESANTTNKFRDQMAYNTQQTLKTGVEAATHHVQEATDQFTSALGFSGEDAERLKGQSKQNMEAVMQCGTLLTHAFQDASQRLFDMGQKQWQRNLSGMNKLMHSKSAHEFSATQSELVREGMQQLVQDSHNIAETSLRAINEADKTFSKSAYQDPRSC